MGLFIVFWLFISACVGVAGSNKKIGFLLTFILSLFLSPVVGLIAALLSKNVETEKKEAKAAALAAKDEMLLDLLKAGTITPDEYQKRKAELI